MINFSSLKVIIDAITVARNVAGVCCFYCAYLAFDFVQYVTLHSIGCVHKSVFATGVFIAGGFYYSTVRYDVS